MLKTTRHLSLREVEDLYSALSNGTAKNILAVELKDKFNPGLFASLIQFYNTWVRKNESSAKKIYTSLLNNTDKENIKEEFEKNFDFFSLYFMCQESDFYLNTPSKSSVKSLSLLRSFYMEVLEILYCPDANKINTSGEKNKYSSSKIKKILSRTYNSSDRNLFVSCFDHDPLLNYPFQFYDESKNIREEDDILNWVKDFFLSKNTKIEQEVKREFIYKHVSEIIQELIDNTDSWAKSDFDGSSYKTNQRGVYLSLTSKDFDNNLGYSNDDKLNTFFKSLQKDSITKNQNTQQEFFNASHRNIAILEVSVIDSGPGLARRFLKKDYSKMTLKEELDAVINCFKKNMTSDDSSESDFRGKGLTRILKIIGKTGLIRVRTGRTSIIRNFVERPLDVTREIKNKEISFSPWDDSRNGYEIAEGTLITIIYPFTY